MPWSAIGALILLAGAAPARAGGYWDAGPGLPPSPAYRDCQRRCARPPPPPCGCERRQFDEEEGPPPEEFARGDVGFEGGVGPAFFDTGGGGGAVFVQNGQTFAGIDIALFEREHLRAMARARAAANANAHASAFASAHSQTYVDTQVHVQQQQHMMQQHMQQPYMMQQHMMQPQMRSYSAAPSYHMSGGHGRR